MRILVVIPHYFGPSHPRYNQAELGSYIEPLGRIAALSELIVGLRRHFGPRRYGSNGRPVLAEMELPEPRLDIVISTIRGHGVLDELGFAPGTFEVEYVKCEPPWLGFHCHRSLRERFGDHDFYCYMEDDLNIHDPAFFDKLTWFQQNFGHRTLLQPVRYEMPTTGSSVKCIIDPELPESAYAPFRRAGQQRELEGVWNGHHQVFSLPSNPHAASFFLTKEQMDYWIQQPIFDDADNSWVGPLESAATFSIGRVFDIYKPLRPDPFFLEVHHFGSRYACHFLPGGGQYGEPPLLAIAQNAVRVAMYPSRELSGGGNLFGNDTSFSELVRHCLEQGTAAESRGRLHRLEGELVSLKNQQLDQVRSLRWLLRTLYEELSRRWRRRGPE